MSLLQYGWAVSLEEEGILDSDTGREHPGKAMAGPGAMRLRAQEPVTTRARARQKGRFLAGLGSVAVLTLISDCVLLSCPQGCETIRSGGCRPVGLEDVVTQP